MRLRLTRLVWITCVALLGIIALQVFWLFKSYDEQKEKLLAIADNTLMETQILTGVNASLNNTVQSLASDLLETAASGKNEKDTLVMRIGKGYSVNILPETLIAGKDELKQKLKKFFNRDSTDRKSYTLAEYKSKIRGALRYKHADIPFELALVGFDGRISSSTTDTGSFAAARLKTSMEYSLPVKLNAKQTGRVQLAFPGAGFYLLKGMWVILLLSLCLISVCAFSFSYMVALFYKQKREAEIRNDFMNNMTHELKTPISSVSVALELLQDKSVAVTEEVKEEYFRIAGNELGRLTELVDKVLRMSAFEKTQVKIRPEWFAVKDWIGTTADSVKPLAEAANAVVEITVQPEALQCFADKDHLTSVLQNLLENAIKYADKNKPELRVAIRARTEKGMFYLEVEDNGKGIPEQYRQRVFDKFFRVPTGDEHETKGYGLGLSYTQEIIRLHQGDIKVESVLKEGTIFIITIPQNM